jgi:PEP-CTERM motif
MRLSLSAFALGAALLAAGLAGLPAQAAVITFVGQCTTDCADIGLTAGDGVLATITVDDAAIAPDAVLDTADVTGFTLDFGDVDIDFLSQHAFHLAATLNATADGFATFLFVASEAAPFEPAGEVVGIAMGLGLDFWAASESGGCDNAQCSRLGINEGSLATGEPVALLLDGLAEIPEPSSAPLLGAALGLMGLSRRKRA